MQASSQQASQKRWRLFWGLALLLSIAFMAAGSLMTSGALASAGVGDDLSSEIKSLTSDLSSDLSIGLLEDLPLPLFFLGSGLPFALLSLFFFRRNQRALSASSVTDKVENNLRRQTLFITILALVFALLIWNMRDVQRMVLQPGQEAGAINLSAITYPVRLFVTFIHEAGHSLAALLSGGQVHGFTVSPDGSGLAATSGGNPALILPAGYLGAALFGSLLFFLTNRIPQWTRSLSILVGLSIILLTLSYAMPDQAGNYTALIVGIGFGVLMVLLGWQAPRILNVFMLNTLAILTGLNAVFDLWSLVGNADAGRGELLNDAAAFSRDITPLLPATMIAFIWALVAVAMSALAIYFGLIKQVEGEISQAVRQNE